jgi:ergothioneine biosynthesis protein EgtB
LDRDRLHEIYRAVRRATEWLCEPLAVEDYVVQTMPDVSPTKWHLAHTSWFFEEFVLKRALPGYRPLDERYGFLFNSYYEAVGRRHARPERGLLSRPTVEEVFHYRRHVDAAMERAFAQADAEVVELGINHEEQHQELLVTDVKHVLAQNPLQPVYRSAREPERVEATPARWSSYEGGVVELGESGDGFAFDNERPRHRVLLRPYQLQHRLVTSGEYLAFIDDGGYRRPELWLADGWEVRQRGDWQAPLYWERSDPGWRLMTLAGARALAPAEPVCHVSYYEAEAFARWAGARLPLETEWEKAAVEAPPTLLVEGNLLDTGQLHPRAALDGSQVTQLYGDVWEWTASAYLPYPGYAPLPGALGEYNGKFMSNRWVLRGGSCATPARHLRATYRNFFPPDARWQFSGIRLAQ